MRIQCHSSHWIAALIPVHHGVVSRWAFAQTYNDGYRRDSRKTVLRNCCLYKRHGSKRLQHLVKQQTADLLNRGLEVCIKSTFTRTQSSFPSLSRSRLHPNAWVQSWKLMHRAAIAYNHNGCLPLCSELTFKTMSSFRLMGIPCSFPRLSVLLSSSADWAESLKGWTMQLQEDWTSKAYGWWYCIWPLSSWKTIFGIEVLSHLWLVSSESQWWINSSFSQFVLQVCAAHLSDGHQFLCVILVKVL